MLQNHSCHLCQVAVWNWRLQRFPSSVRDAPTWESHDLGKVIIHMIYNVTLAAEFWWFWWISGRFFKAKPAKLQNSSILQLGDSLSASPNAAGPGLQRCRNVQNTALYGSPKETTKLKIQNKSKSFGAKFKTQKNIIHLHLPRLCTSDLMSCGCFLHCWEGEEILSLGKWPEIEPHLSPSESKKTDPTDLQQFGGILREFEMPTNEQGLHLVWSENAKNAVFRHILARKEDLELMQG